MVKPLGIFKLVAEPSWLTVVTMEGMLEEVATSVKFAVAVVGLLCEETPALPDWVDLLVVAGLLCEETPALPDWVDLIVAFDADSAGVADGFLHLVSVHVTVSRLVVKMVDVMTFTETSVCKLYDEPATTVV